MIVVFNHGEVPTCSGSKKCTVMRYLKSVDFTNMSSCACGRVTEPAGEKGETELLQTSEAPIYVW